VKIVGPFGGDKATARKSQVLMEERLDVMVTRRGYYARPVQRATKNFADARGRGTIQIWAGAEQNKFPLGA
jgi:hypothetical protein